MGNFRGVVKVSGSAIRGWILDLDRPARPVRFQLAIDGEVRGSYVADARRRFLSRKAPGQESHGFSIPIRKPWISGGMQALSLKGAEGLRFAMQVRLGPRPQQHFEDHVVSGEASLGAGTNDPRGARAERDEESAATLKPGLLRQVRALSDAELAQLLFVVDRDILLERLSRHEKDGNWKALAHYRRALLGVARGQVLGVFSRGASSAQEHGPATRAAAAAAAMHPQSFEVHLLAGAALAAQGAFDEALRHLRSADLLEENGLRAKREIATLLPRMLRQDLAPERRAALREEQLEVLRALSAAHSAALRLRYRVSLASALYERGRYDEAIAAASEVLAEAPRELRAHLVKARALVACNRIAEAKAHYQTVLDVDPAHRGARQSLRILSALADAEAQDDMRIVDARDVSIDDLPALKRAWVCTARASAAAGSMLEALSQDALRRSGYVELAAGDGAASFWRSEALAGLAESGLVDTLEDRAALARWQRFYAADPIRGGGAGRALLVSRHGSDRYGGGEHFLEDVAAYHESQGYEVIILGTRPELEGEDRRDGGRRRVFLPENAAALRGFILENDVALVHAISGMGFVVAEALGFSNIPFIYGVHFWNEILGDGEGRGYFDEASGEPVYRREFSLLLSRASVVYANSRYTQQVLEEGFGVRCPILFAAPRERLVDAQAAC